MTAVCCGPLDVLSDRVLVQTYLTAEYTPPDRGVPDGREGSGSRMMV